MRSFKLTGIIFPSLLALLRLLLGAILLLLVTISTPIGLLCARFLLTLRRICFLILLRIVFFLLLPVLNLVLDQVMESSDRAD